MDFTYTNMIIYLCGDIIYLHVYAQAHGSDGRDTRVVDPCEYWPPTQVGHEKNQTDQYWI